jgi:hypothetical protein
LSEELPKNGDVPKSPLPAIGSLDAVGGTKTFKNLPWFVSRVPPALAFLHIRALAARALSFHTVKRETGEQDESTYPTRNDDHSTAVLDS